MTRKLIEQMLEAMSPMESPRDDTSIQRAITAAREYLAQPEQSEPVGEVVSSGPADFPIFQWVSADHSLRCKTGDFLYLHTAPPLRELSDAEIMEVSNAIERSDFFDIVIPFARAILAAARRKTP